MLHSVPVSVSVRDVSNAYCEVKGKMRRGYQSNCMQEQDEKEGESDKSSAHEWREMVELRKVSSYHGQR